MSYAKQMGDIATEWARANPGAVDREQDNVVLRLPAGCRDAVEYHRWASSIASPASAKLITLGWWCVLWHRSGRNVFDLSPDFVAAMLLTDPASTALEDVRLPFPAILVTIPAGFASGVEGLPYTKIHVSGRCRANGSRVVLIHATDGAHCLSHAIDAADLTWDAVEESLADDSPPIVGHVKIDNDSDAIAQRTVVRVVVGMLGYIAAVEGAVTPHAGHRPPKHPVAPSHATPHWEVGRAIKIGPQLVQAARGGSREIALRIKHRFIVRGHYRNQPCGPAHGDRRMQWIAPHWKGPEAGAQIVHTYKPQPPP